MKFNNKGMTLVELLVTFTLLLVIVVGLYNLILEVKFEIDDKQILKDTIEYSSLMNKDIHYNLLIDKPFAISYKNNASDEWKCFSTSDNKKCVVNVQNISISYTNGVDNDSIWIQKDQFDPSICKKVYPCAVYYYFKSDKKIGAKVIALSKYREDDENNDPNLKDGLKAKGILYGSFKPGQYPTDNKSVFEPIPNNEFIEIRDIEVKIGESGGTPTIIEANAPSITVTEEKILVINYGFYIIDDDHNYGFKIAYPFS